MAFYAKYPPLQLKKFIQQNINGMTLLGGVYSPSSGRFDGARKLEITNELEESFSICFDCIDFDINPEDEDDNGHYFEFNFEKIEGFSEDSYPIDISSTTSVSELALWYQFVYSNDENECVKSAKALTMMMSDTLDILLLRNEHSDYFDLYLKVVPDFRSPNDFLNTDELLRNCHSECLT